MTPRYAINRDTDRTWVEICDSTAPHVNGVGMPVARVIDAELAGVICAALNSVPCQSALQRLKEDCLTIVAAGVGNRRHGPLDILREIRALNLENY